MTKNYKFVARPSGHPRIFVRCLVATDSMNNAGVALLEFDDLFISLHADPESDEIIIVETTSLHAWHPNFEYHKLLEINEFAGMKVYISRLGRNNYGHDDCISLEFWVDGPNSKPAKLDIVTKGGFLDIYASTALDFKSSLFG